jgi:hypothetical protein
MRPVLPSCTRSWKDSPRRTYFFAMDTTRRRLACTMWSFAAWPLRKRSCGGTARASVHHAAPACAPRPRPRTENAGTDMPTAAAHSAVVGARCNSACTAACVRSSSRRSCGGGRACGSQRRCQQRGMGSTTPSVPHLNLSRQLNLFCGGEERHLAHLFHHAQRLLAVVATATRALCRGICEGAP